MQFDYTFEGIETSKGQHPRAIVAVRPDAATAAAISEALFMPSVKIVLPLGPTSHEKSLDAISAQALASARELLNESALANWLDSQS